MIAQNSAVIMMLLVLCGKIHAIFLNILIGQIFRGYHYNVRFLSCV